MGTWGAHSFQNDWALDWLASLLETHDDLPIRNILREVVQHGGTKRSAPSILERLCGRSHHTDWLTVNVASKAIAAAEIVAAAHGRPPAHMPDDAVAWLAQHRAVEQDLLPLAQRAVEIIKTGSELKDVWEEGDASEWKKAIEDLEKRL